MYINLLFADLINLTGSDGLGLTVAQMTLESCRRVRAAGVIVQLWKSWLYFLSHC